MKFYHALFVSETLKGKKDEILNKVVSGKLQYKKFLIALTENEKNHLEFFDSVLLIQKAISKDNLFVVGLADGYGEAVELVRQITEMVYTETQGTNIREYLIKEQQKFEESNV